MPHTALYPSFDTVVSMYPLTRDPLQGVFQTYYQRLVAHILAVQEAAKQIGVPEEQIEIHDLSKFSREEFAAYAMHFHGGGSPDFFPGAWLHHIHNNPHHWQHWMFPDGFHLKDSEMEGGVVFMPNYYALEMIADWMGASKVYSGTNDMSDWLAKNIPKITLHSRTAEYVRQTLDALGYADIVNRGLEFKHG